MCLLAVQYRVVKEAPILVAANREEAFDRASVLPTIQSGKPRVLCGVDQQAGGTWLGINQHGLFVAVANRPRPNPPPAPRSRGLLARDLLRCNSARQAVDTAMEELTTGKYEGVSYLIADVECGFAVHGGEEVEAVEMDDGLNILANGDLNDMRDERVRMAHRLLTLQTLDSPVKFLAVASKVFSRTPTPQGRPSIVVRGQKSGTVSSTLISLSSKPRDAIFQYAAGAPDTTKFEDYSPLLRDILSRGLRESRTRVKA